LAVAFSTNECCPFPAPTIARNAGGGVQSGGTTTILDSAIFDNSASSTGGGLRLAGTVTLTNTTIARNTAASHGGGIYLIGGPATKATITNITISGNESGSGFGGGIAGDGQVEVQLQNSILLR
jgi:predicted outer membrane repeat protein